MPKTAILSSLILPFSAVIVMTGCTGTSTRSTEQNVTLSQNETLAVRDLRQPIFAAEVQVKSGILLDQDHNQVGEYMSLAQLAGRDPLPTGITIAMLPGPLKDSYISDAYVFSSILPSGSKGLLMEIDRQKDAPLTGVTDRERFFAVLAWPVMHGGRAFVLFQDGRIFYHECGPARPAADSAVAYDPVHGTWTSPWPELSPALVAQINEFYLMEQSAVHSASTAPSPDPIPQPNF